MSFSQPSQPVPYRLVAESTLRALCGALAQAVGDWAAEWGCAGHVEVTVQRACDSAAARALAWKHGIGAVAGQAWVAIGPGLGPELQQLLFPADMAYGLDRGGAAPIAGAGARHALDALLDAVEQAALPGRRDAVRAEAAEVPAAVWRRGAGAVAVTITIGRKLCGVLLGSTAVQAFQEVRAALPALAPVDFEACVASVPVTLTLDLGAARVGLGALLSLGEGDVIRLDRAADAPLALRTVAGDVLSGAYLGRTGASLAVEVVKHQC